MPCMEATFIPSAHSSWNNFLSILELYQSKIGSFWKNIIHRSYKNLIHYQHIIEKSEKCCLPESKIKKSNDTEMFVQRIPLDSVQACVCAQLHTRVCMALCCVSVCVNATIERRNGSSYLDGFMKASWDVGCVL